MLHGKPRLVSSNTLRPCSPSWIFFFAITFIGVLRGGDGPLPPPRGPPSPFRPLSPSPHGLIPPMQKASSLSIQHKLVVWKCTWEGQIFQGEEKCSSPVPNSPRQTRPSEPRSDFDRKNMENLLDHFWHFCLLGFGVGCFPWMMTCEYLRTYVCMSYHKHVITKVIYQKTLRFLKIHKVRR